MILASLKFIQSGLFDATADGVEASVEFYNRWVEEVKTSVPADRLLVFNVKQGWEPLCRFLGLLVPETPFPHLNETAEFRKMLDRFKAASFVTVWVLPAVVAAAVGGLFWRENLTSWLANLFL